jgi:hypothetical protein
MGDAGTATKKARAEVDNVVDEVVLTIQHGVTHPDGTDGFDPAEAERLRDRLRTLAATIVAAARREPAADIDAALDRVVETIRKGVIHPADSPGFGADQAAELRAHLGRFAAAIVAADGERNHAEIDAAMDGVVKALRSGLFLVYGRASYAAITADQLEAYLETFVDAVITVVEKGAASGRPNRPPRAASA